MASGDSEAWVQLALAKLGCAQKDLAARVGVSPTQISKWKSGERMSSDMEKRFRDITGIGELDPRFVVSAGSVSDAEKWEKLIHHLAEDARFNDESGYDTYPLQDDLGLLGWHTFHTLEEMGVAIPKPFPAELDIDFDDPDLEEDVYEVLSTNPHTQLIRKVFKSLTDIWGFYAAYVYDLAFDEDLDLYDTGSEVESCLMSLAACKIDVDQGLAPNLKAFRYETLKNYREWLNEIKEKAFKAGKPLKAELLSLVYDEHDSLGHDAEAENLGLNDTRLHPDVYMNELLRGMRVIHQVLPAIVKKLGIDETEFQLDLSELSLGK